MPVTVRSFESSVHTAACVKFMDFAVAYDPEVARSAAERYTPSVCLHNGSLGVFVFMVFIEAYDCCGYRCKTGGRSQDSCQTEGGQASQTQGQSGSIECVRGR